MAITTVPVLQMPLDDGKYKVEADSSDYATGAVLSQEQDGRWHPIAFLSRSLSDTERNYDIFDKEMLAIIRALEEWRHHLQGAKEPFEIWTDHQNLKYFTTMKKLNRHQARWALFLSEFNFLLHHRPGKTAGKPDALSRRPDHKPTGPDNDDMVLLKPQWFARAAGLQGHMEVEGVSDRLLREIRQATELDEEVKQALGRQDPQWTSEQGLHLYQGMVYVPPKEGLRTKVISAHHDTLIVGHPGQDKTLELVLRNYWWPNIGADV